jgi:hypothetical protein
MPAFLRVHPLQNVAQAEGGGLLRVLFLRICGLPAHSRAAQSVGVDGWLWLELSAVLQYSAQIPGMLVNECVF